MTVGEWLRHARECLSGDDLRDAEILLAAATGKSVAALMADSTFVLSDELHGRCDELLERRAGGEPVAYILGEKEFWSVMLTVTPDVLIPRPETELLVEEVLANAPFNSPCDILELGTGSGAIAIALARELPQCQITATDNSKAALAVAADNVKKLSVQIELCHGDWFEAVANRRFDFIVANPPYIAPDDVHLTQGDVRFEPTTALVSKPDGLHALQKIITGAGAHLNDDGVLLVEHGYTQGEAVRELFCANGFRDVATKCDLAGCERMTGGRK